MKKLGSPPDSRNHSDDGDISDASPPRRPRPIPLQSSREQMPSGDVSDASPPRRRPTAVPRQSPWDQRASIGDVAPPHRMNDTLERSSRLPIPPKLPGAHPHSTKRPASQDQDYEIVPQPSEKRRSIEHNGVERGGFAWSRNPGIAHPGDGVSARSNAKIGPVATSSSVVPASGAAAEDPLLERRQPKQRLSFNRYNISAGPRWDGVDRSVGFEMDIETMKAERNEADRSAYKASVSDM